MDDFRQFFLRGLGALIPTLLTFAVLIWAYRLVDQNVGVYITDGLRRLCMMIRDEPAAWAVSQRTLLSDALQHGRPLEEWNERGQRLTVEYVVIRNYQTLLNRPPGEVDPGTLAAARQGRNEALWRVVFAKYHLHVFGFLIAIILVYFTGFFLASFIGRTTWRAAEGMLARIPLIRAVYPNIKQVTDFLLSERTVEFSGVVAVEYPRKGVWSLALSTGGPMGQVQRRVPEELVTVFIPSSPTPMTGYVVQIPRADVIELNMTIDEGLRFTISGGVIKPGAPFPGSGPGGEAGPPALPPDPGPVGRGA